MDSRLPAHVEIAGLIRSVNAEGGFATVLAKGERDAGTILILTMDSARNGQLWERMPMPDGSRSYRVAKKQTTDNKEEFEEYLRRRQQQDSDCWIVELDVPNPERFIAAAPG